MAESIGIELVPIEDIQTDMRYQREVTSRVERIGKNFDEKLANVVILSRRPDGSCFVIDGQHRVKGARIAKRSHMLSAVYEGLTLQDEARMFDQVNNNRAMMPALDRFKARLVYREPVAMRLNQIINGFGVQVGNTPKSFKAIGGAERAFKTYGEKALIEALSVIKDSYGTIKTGASSSNMVLALAIVMHSKVVAKPDIVDALRTMPGGRLALERRARAAQDANGGWAVRHLAAEIVKVARKRGEARKRTESSPTSQRAQDLVGLATT